jgi:putative ubiquitin-RnfH superfamily antitoxin RatB of RatAB toxin-antitoxin module
VNESLIKRDYSKFKFQLILSIFLAKIFLRLLDDAYLDSLDSQQIQSTTQLNIKLRSIQNNSESIRLNENRKGVYVKSTLQKVPLQNDDINKCICYFSF